MLGSKFVKFLMSVLKLQVNSSPGFASFFIVITHNSSVNFKLIHFLLSMKGPNKSPNFGTFICSGRNLRNSSCHFPNNMSVFLRTLHHSSVSWKITHLQFLGQTLYTLHERDQPKCKFLRLLSAQIKINQVLVILETTNQLFFKFCITLQHHET